MNFLTTRCLDSTFDILEEFARALALGLRGRGILLLLRVLAVICGARIVRKESRRARAQKNQGLKNQFY